MPRARCTSAAPGRGTREPCPRQRWRRRQSYRPGIGFRCPPTTMSDTTCLHGASHSSHSHNHHTETAGRSPRNGRREGALRKPGRATVPGRHISPWDYVAEGAPECLRNPAVPVSRLSPRKIKPARLGLRLGLGRLVSQSSSLLTRPGHNYTPSKKEAVSCTTAAGGATPGAGRTPSSTVRCPRFARSYRPVGGMSCRRQLSLSNYQNLNPLTQLQHHRPEAPIDPTRTSQLLTNYSTQTHYF